MPSEPQFTPDHIAHDIERLTHELEAKRQQLASTSETHEDKEILRQVIGERIQAAPAPAPQQQSSVVVPDDPVADTDAEFPNYLAGASSDVKSRVHQLVQIAMHSGIEKATSRAKAESTYVLDAFHDALVDKLYNELKGRGVFR